MDTATILMIALVLSLSIGVVVILARMRRGKRLKSQQQNDPTSIFNASSIDTSPSGTPTPASLTETSPDMRIDAIQNTETAEITNVSAQKSSREAKSKIPDTVPDMPVMSLADAPGMAASSGDKIRILIVDDNKETIEHVTRLLYFEDDMEVIGQAFDGRQGVEMATEKRPHIVLMDINMPDMDGIAATRALVERSPSSQVIMISVQSDPEYMKQAMLAGARDYQPKPFSVEELVSCIRRVYDIGRPVYEQYELAQTPPEIAAARSSAQALSTDKSGKVIALYSPKGGTGVTTIAANLAMALQKTQGSVILVDADLQFGDVLVHLNTRDSRSFSNLIQGGTLALDILPEVIVPHVSGLNLLLAPQKPEVAELITPTAIVDILTDLRRRFDTIIVDTGKLLSDQMLAVLEQADQTIVVAFPEIPSIKSIKLFLELGLQLELPVQQMSLIINCADRTGGIPLKQITGALKLPRTFAVPTDFDMHNAVNSGKLIGELNPKSSAARAIRKLAEIIIQPEPQAEGELAEEVA